MVGARQRIQRLAACTEHLDRERQIEGRTDCGDPETPLEIALAQPCVDERGLPARVRADEQTGVGFLDAGDRRVE
jgi:hypothetical protein